MRCEIKPTPPTHPSGAWLDDVDDAAVDDDVAVDDDDDDGDVDDVVAVVRSTTGCVTGTTKWGAAGLKGCMVARLQGGTAGKQGCRAGQVKGYRAVWLQGCVASVLKSCRAEGCRVAGLQGCRWLLAAQIGPLPTRAKKRLTGIAFGIRNSYRIDRLKFCCVLWSESMLGRHRAQARAPL